MSDKKFYIIGAGRVGSAFAIELHDAGFRIDFVTGRNPEHLDDLISRSGAITGSVKIEKDFIENSDVVIVCVQDRFIKAVANEISSFGQELKEKFFIHTSGSETSEVFSNEFFDRNNVLSMHPVQTFDKISFDNNRLLAGIYFGIEGGEAAKEVARSIVEVLGSKSFEVLSDKKHLYHSACVISSNFLVTLLSVSSEIMASIGIEKSMTFEIFRPIIEKTISNIAEKGFVDSLTGPFERNDVGTITNHLNSINAELPWLIPFYTLLGMETVKVAFKKESLNLKNVISILDLMNDYIKKEASERKEPEK